MRQISLAALALVVLAAVSAQSQSTTQSAKTDPRRNAVVDVFDRTKAGVVNISTQHLVEQNPFGGWPGYLLFDEFFGGRQMRQKVPVRNLGTGFIVAGDGAVLTNHHVVARAQEIIVTLVSGEKLEAELIGAAPDADLALLKLKAEGIKLPLPLKFSRSQPLIGETAIAIGNPYGLDHSITVGVVSAVDRTLETGDRVYAGVLQSDASINPGNSGGPLLNILGEVIGVNTAIYQEAQGIGFAIPADTAARILEELQAKGKLTAGWLGIELQDLNKTLALSLGLKASEGVLISNVIAESPAEQAGLKAGDLVTQLGGHKIRARRDLVGHLETYSPKQALPLTVRRGDNEQSLKVNVGAYDRQRINGWFERMGLIVKQADRYVAVVGVRPGSKAQEIGFKPGDAIVSLDRIPLANLEDLQNYLLQHRQKSYFLVGLVRNNYRYSAGLQLPPPDPSY